VNRLRRLVLGLSGLTALAISMLWAETPLGGGAGGFSMPLKRDGRTYLKFSGSGTEAISPTVLRVRDFQVETFRADETPELVGRAPECVLNLTTKSASSAGPIRIEQVGGRFTHEGTGFSWDHESGRLEISSRVRSTVRLNPFGRTKP
jgi:hypothetical protein